MKPLFVEVIIPLALPKNYTWKVPEQFQDSIAPGIRVEVALRKNKRYAGIRKLDIPQTWHFEFVGIFFFLGNFFFYQYRALVS